MVSQSETDDEEWDDADWSEDASAGYGIQYVSLFCDKSFKSAEECFQYDRATFTFDIRAFIAEVGRLVMYTAAAFSRPLQSLDRDCPPRSISSTTIASSSV